MRAGSGVGFEAWRAPLFVFVIFDTVTIIQIPDTPPHFPPLLKAQKTVDNARVTDS